MSELFESLGFFTNPFSRFSAEQELEYLDGIFVEPRYYNVLCNDIKCGTSKFIIGDRGSGKSALMYSIREKLIKEKVFCSLVDSYYDISISNNKCQFLRIIANNVITNLSLLLVLNKKVISNLSNEDKQKLSNLIYSFYSNLSKEELENRIDLLTGFKKWNVCKKVLNTVFNQTLNHIISGAIEVSSDFIARSLSLPRMEASLFYKDYIPEFKLKDSEEYSSINLQTLTESNYLNIFKTISSLVQKLNFKTTIVFLDKIDEFQLLKGKISNISEFIHELAADTTFLQLEGIGFEFVIWSKTKKPLSGHGVRFDKFRPIDVNWVDQDIRNILEKRIRFFSRNRKTAKDIFSMQSLDSITLLSNKSPRDLITLCSYIYDEQSIIDDQVKQISDTAVRDGIRNYVLKYDYESYYASSEVAQKVMSLINRILLLGMPQFTLKDLAASIKKSPTSASNYTRDMKDYGFIIEIPSGTTSEKVYKINDPKIIYLINSGIKNIE